MSEQEKKAGAKALANREQQLEAELRAARAALDAEKSKTAQQRLHNVAFELRAHLRGFAIGWKVGKQRQAKDAAEHRNGVRDPLRSAIVAALRQHRMQGRTLQQALDSLVTNPTDDLRVTVEQGGYLFQGDKSKFATIGSSTIESWWTEAGKPTSR